jgi:hypothetical protein
MVFTAELIVSIYMVDDNVQNLLDPEDLSIELRVAIVNYPDKLQVDLNHFEISDFGHLNFPK